MTSLKQTSLFTEETSTSYQVASLANHTQQQEGDLAKKMKDTSGRKCLEQLGKFNQVGLWEKTFADLLIGTGDWYSTRCNLTWKLRATKSCRFYFQLQVLVQDTKDKEFGLLPTPNAMDWNTAQQPQTYIRKKERHLKKKVNLQMTLKQMAANFTPTGNPTYKLKNSFVEEMMGFPKDWTLLAFLNGEKKV